MVVVETAEIPISVRVGNEDIPFMSVDSMFRDTPYGDILLDRSRWGDFKPLGMSDEEFQSIIGVDGNNLKHLSLTYGTTRLFIAYCDNPPDIWGDKPAPEFSEKQKMKLLLCAVVHDWGEARVGDTAQPNKTTEAEKKEMVELLRIAREVAGDNNALYELIHESVNEVLLHPESYLAKTFNAIEKIGYHRTGLHAWKESTKHKKQKGMEDRLRGMAFSVHTHNVADLVKYSDEFPPVFAHLIANAETISEIYRTHPKKMARMLHKYQNKKTIDELKTKYIAQREAWNTWREQHETEIALWKSGVR